MSLANVIVLALATWRIASLLAYEDGPYNILVKFRFKLGIGYDEYANQVGTSMIAKLFMCVWCLSLWVGLIVTLLYICLQDIALFALLPFALSAVAIIIHTKTED